MSIVNIIHYSEKAFILVGDTKQFKEGKWNSKLKIIIKKKKFKQSQRILKKQSINYKIITDESDAINEENIKQIKHLEYDKLKRIEEEIIIIKKMLALTQ